MTEVEPEWDADTRNWALALADLEADTCPHGHRLSDAMHVDGHPDPEFEVAYEACTACAALERAQRIQSQADESPEAQRKKDTLKTAYDYPSARLWFAKPVDPGS